MAMLKADEVNQEDEIYLLHQLEETIMQEITREQKLTGNERIVCAWKILTSLLPEHNMFYSLGVKPYKARGLLAEIMARTIFEEWAIQKRKDYIYYSNLLIPRADRGTAQIDGLFITKNFSAVIECKSFYGKMSIIDGAIKGSTKSVEPWKQNYGHIISLKNLLGEALQIYFHNIVYIFSEGLITEYEEFPDEYLMVNRVGFSLLDSIDENPSYVGNLSDSDLKLIKDTLAEYVPTVEQEVEHIKFIKTLIGSE